VVSVYRRNQTIVLSYLVALTFLILMSLYKPGFGVGNVAGLRSLSIQAAIIAIVALGQTLVIISGGVDLSVPWTLTGAAVLFSLIAQSQDGNTFVASAVVFGFCVAVGLTNGLLIARLAISPVIVTLGMNAILLGLIAGITSGGNAILGTHPGAPPFLITMTSGLLFAVPNLVWITAALALFATILLSWSRFGRKLYAIGSSSVVAMYSGIDVAAVTVQVYVFSALTSGFAGVLLTGRIGRAYLGMGDPYLFISVAAVVIGGASILGGSGHYIGTIGGALLLAVLTAALPVLQLPRAFELATFGLVILFAVFIASRQEAT
jgi:ribose transport system permease protein